MERDISPPATAQDDAQRPLPPGPLIRISHGSLCADIAPQAGGRIAQITFDHVPWLSTYGHAHAAMIAWGSYPMVPWAGRVRHGRFHFQGRDHRLPANLGEHAIHGVGFGKPWQVERHSSRHIDLSLRLPEDAQWPFGGIAHQRISVDERRLHMMLTVTAGEHDMPACIGWHPWFLKPDQIDFHPSRLYPRDAEGIAVLPLAAPPDPPWDDCFINEKPVLIHRQGQCLQLSSNCDHWVVYDEPGHATCIEPQTGPPDAFNLNRAQHLLRGKSLSAWFLLEWH